jgi:hypothetical protein
MAKNEIPKQYESLNTMKRRPIGVLRTESTKEFARRHRELANHFRPRGPLENHYVGDSAYVGFETDRFRRIGPGLLDACFVEALENLLKQLLSREDFDTHLDLERAAEHLARHYWCDRQVKAEVLKLLGKFQLDEVAIEAEAFRLCARELELLDRMVAFRTGRHDKNLSMLAEIRQCDQLQPASDPVPECEIPQLVAIAKRGG